MLIMSFSRPGSGRSSLEEFQTFSQCSIRETFHKSRKYPATKALQEELENCKEQLGQMEVKAVAAEAEVISLGFQKVAMEHEVSKYKEKVKKLTEQLNAGMEENRKRKEEVHRKISFVKRALTKQFDEFRTSEKDMRMALESFQQCVNQFKSEVITKELFFSQVETVFDRLHNKNLRAKNGKILKTAKSFDERVRSNFTPPPNLSDLEADSTEKGSDNDPFKKSSSPPPIPPRTSTSSVNHDTTPTSDQKRPFLKSRHRLTSSRKCSLPVELLITQRLPSAIIDQVGLPKPLIKKRNSRECSRVNSLYSLAPPPGSPILKQTSVGSFFFAGDNWSRNSDSDSSDFEQFTPPRRRKRQSLKPQTESHEYLDTPTKELGQESDAKAQELESEKSIDPKPNASSQKSPVPSPIQTRNLSREDSLSTSQEFTPKSPHSPIQDDREIKKSSPIMTKRPLWLPKRNSKAISESKIITPSVSEKKVQKRSNSLDDLLRRRLSTPVSQEREPQAHSDSEDTTGGSTNYSKPFQHIQSRQKSLGIDSRVVGPPIKKKLEMTQSAWHVYDEDSDSDSEGMYINPDEVPERNSPKGSFEDSQEIPDNTYMKLSQLDAASRRRIDISVNSPSPVPLPSSESRTLVSHVPDPLSKYLAVQAQDSVQSTCSSDASSGNEFNSEDLIEANDLSSNIYEIPSDYGHSPIFDNQAYGSGVHVNGRCISSGSDGIYEQIDVVRHSVEGTAAPKDTHVANVKQSTNRSASPLLRTIQQMELTQSRAYYSTSDAGMQEEDGYASVSEIMNRFGGEDLAPSLPPRPLRLSHDGRASPRTVPGIGSLPRYTTLGGTEREVPLVALDKTLPRGNSDSTKRHEAMSSSLPNQPFTTSPSHSPVPPPSNKTLRTNQGTPNLAKYNIHTEDTAALPSLDSFHAPAKPVLSTDGGKTWTRKNNLVSSNPKRSATVSYPGDRQVLAQYSPSLSEKSGYLYLQYSKQKPKKKWFVLKGTELKYYSNKDTRKKTPKVINLDKWCKLMTTETKNGFYLATTDTEYHFTASSQAECEDWLRVIEESMQDLASQTDTSENSSQAKSEEATLSGWATVDGNAKTVWCWLEGCLLSISTEEGVKPHKQFQMDRCSVKWRRDSILLDNSSSNLRAKVLVIHDKDTGKTTSIQPTRDELKEQWFYLLNTTQCGDMGPELTRTELLLSEIMKDHPISHNEHPKWKHPILNMSSVPLRDPLLSLPSSSLKLRAKEVSKYLHRFLRTMIESTMIEYHISLAQTIVGQCLIHSHLQNEIYCMLLRQLSGQTTPAATTVLQGWLLLFLLIPMYLPSRKIISWYLNVFLDRSVSSKSPIISELAKNCQKRLKVALSNGPRQCTPTYFELKALFGEFVSSPHVPPTGIMTTSIYLADDCSHDIDFTSTTTVTELISQLAEQVGLPDSSTTGFALMCDWPGVDDGVLCCPFVESKVCDVISMWSMSMEKLNQHVQVTNLEQRNISFTYRRRLSFRKHQRFESNLECVLLAHQISKDVLTGLHPVRSKQAIHLSAIMAQIEYGDYESLDKDSGVRETTAREAVECFCPWNLTHLALEHDWQRLQSGLVEKWKELEGETKEECARSYLHHVRSWNLHGASLFKAEQHPCTSQNKTRRLLWLAIHEDGVSLLDKNTMEVLKCYCYSEISTFGGHGDDHFMLVVSPQMSPDRGTSVITRGEKIMLSMSKIPICEATFLMATYIARVKDNTKQYDC